MPAHLRKKVGEDLGHEWFCPDMEWWLGRDTYPSLGAGKHCQVLQFTCDQPLKSMWRRVSILFITFTLQNSHIQGKISCLTATDCTDRPISGHVTANDGSPVKAQLICPGIAIWSHFHHLQLIAHTAQMALVHMQGQKGQSSKNAMGRLQNRHLTDTRSFQGLKAAAYCLMHCGCQVCLKDKTKHSFIFITLLK